MKSILLNVVDVCNDDGILCVPMSAFFYLARAIPMYLRECANEQANEQANAALYDCECVCTLYSVCSEEIERK